MVEFALDWLAGLYGSEVKKAVKRTHATQWNKEPWALGAFSAAAPGGQPSRMALAEPFRDRLWFAGEAVHETLWGTVGGAWASGDRAAAAGAAQDRRRRRAAARAAGHRRPPATVGTSTDIICLSLPGLTGQSSNPCAVDVSKTFPTESPVVTGSPGQAGR